ncbi:MAG TPA: hypothetical protein VHC44_18290 [Verrucomicrobiae bacterium]|nr:hypothetical protein [Verrucomicrobiae bacterium]
MNLFATPGLGSLMGGRILPGLGQLILFLVGFVFICLWFVKTMKEYYSLMGEEIPIHVSYFHYFLAGFMFAAVSWFWSLLTSLSMMRHAKTPEPALPGSVPPKLGP